MNSHLFVASAVDGDGGVHFISADEDLLGQRFTTIVVYRTSPRFDQEYVDEWLRCRLEPGGTWIEVR